ncbi:MAG TPA: hypothetical protein VK211_06345 [Kamptonema sp.]|nr:hypothetical protein [Kamptonema sp.]
MFLSTVCNILEKWYDNTAEDLAEKINYILIKLREHGVAPGYEAMNIRGVTGLTKGQKSLLKNLGTVE